MAYSTVTVMASVDFIRVSETGMVLQSGPDTGCPQKGDIVLGKTTFHS